MFKTIMGFGPQPSEKLPLGDIPESPTAPSFKFWLRGYDILDFVSVSNEIT